MKMCYLHTVGSATEKNEARNFAGQWMELEKILLSDVTQTQKDKHYVFFLIGAPSSKPSGMNL